MEKIGSIEIESGTITIGDKVGLKILGNMLEALKNIIQENNDNYIRNVYVDKIPKGTYTVSCSYGKNKHISSILIEID